MNIFEAETLIKKIENENIRFPRIDRVKNYEKVRVHREEKEKFEIQEVRRISFELDDIFSDIINKCTARIAEQQANTINNWMIKQLGEFGVSESEIFDRVSMRVSGIDSLRQTNHVFIDGHYVFSFSSGCDFSENGQSYTTWIKPEHIPQMIDMEV